MVQNVVIAVLVLNYSGKASAAAVFVAGLAAAAGTLFAPSVLDMQTLGYLQMGAGALGVASKLPQIVTVWQEGGTGQLSAFAVSIPFYFFLFSSDTTLHSLLLRSRKKCILIICE